MLCFSYNFVFFSLWINDKRIFIDNTVDDAIFTIKFKNDNSKKNNLKTFVFLISKKLNIFDGIMFSTEFDIL